MVAMEAVSITLDLRFSMTKGVAAKAAPTRMDFPVAGKGGVFVCASMRASRIA
jgi:hypothetical protein